MKPKSNLKKENPKKTRSVITYVFIILVVLLLALLVVKSNSGKPIKISDHDPVFGHKDAPVTMLMFGKFSCSVTGDFFSDYYPWIKERYVDTGKVRFVYKNFVFSYGSDKFSAEEASLCANEQMAFWEYSNLLFERQSEWRDFLKNDDESGFFQHIFGQYAGELNLNEEVFLECLYSRKYRSLIGEDYDYARGLKASKTPFFFINGLMLNGLPSSEEMESVLLKFNYN